MYVTRKVWCVRVYMGRYGVWEGNDVACVKRISATTFNTMNTSYPLTLACPTRVMNVDCW